MLQSPNRLIISCGIFLSATRRATPKEHGKALVDFLKLMVCMNKFYEASTWRQFKERVVGLSYRSELEKKKLELPEELQIKMVLR